MRFIRSAIFTQYFLFVGLMPGIAQAKAVDGFISTSSGQGVTITLSVPYDVSGISAGNAAHGTVTVNQSSPGNPGSVTFTYTPIAGYTGSDSFDYTATFAAASPSLTMATVTVRVGAFNKPSDSPSLRMLQHMEKMCSSGSGGQAPTALVGLCSELSNISAQDIGDFLRQLMPLSLGGQTQITITQASQQIDNVRKRLAALRLGVSGTSSLSQLYLRSNGQLYSLADMMSLTSNGGGASADMHNRVGIFASGHFGAGSHDENENEAGYDNTARGVSAGADYRITEKFVAGVALGNNFASMDIYNDGGNVNVGGYSLLAYSSYYLTRKAYIEAVWSVHKNSLDSRRNINYSVNNISKSDSAYSETDNGIANISVGIGYDAYFKRGLTANVEANIDILKTAFDGYVESGAGDKNLVVGKRESTLTVYSLGTQVSYAVKFSDGVLIPQGNFAWKHEFEKDPSQFSAYFRDDPSQRKFSFNSELPDTDYFLLNLGVSYIDAGGTAGYLNYEKTLGKTGYSLYTFNMGLRVPMD